jgi:prepilin-type N-terminal cleavage/methylation domain-containing protein
MRRTDRGRRARAGSVGYTLIELVVVISIGGILAAFVGPRFFDQQTFSQRGYADELAAALRGTQKAAVITGCPARLVLASGSYAANQQAASNNTCNTGDTTWATAVVGGDGSAIAGNAPSGTSASPTGTFQFDSQGRLTSSPASSVTIGSRSITIDAATGFVRVQ